MAKLRGEPGEYTLPHIGYLITKSGIVECPDEIVEELLEYGFVLYEETEEQEPAQIVNGLPLFGGTKPGNTRGRKATQRS